MQNGKKQITNEIDLNTAETAVCRVCLRKFETEEDCKNSKNMFETYLVNQSYSEIYEYCIGRNLTRQINNDQRLPTNACVECVNCLLQTFIFKLQCTRTEDQLINSNTPKMKKRVNASEVKNCVNAPAVKVCVNAPDVKNCVSAPAIKDCVNAPEVTSVEEVVPSEIVSVFIKMEPMDTEEEEVTPDDNVEYLEEYIKPEEIQVFIEETNCDEYFDENSNDEWSLERESEKNILPKESHGKIDQKISQLNINSRKLVPNPKRMAKKNENISFTCKFCKESFKNIAVLNSHIQKHHDRAVTYNCIECDKVFDSYGSYCYHVTLKHNEVYYCEVCDFTTNTLMKLKVHHKSHFSSGFSRGTRKIENPSYKCEYCDKTYIYLKGLYSHRITKHMKQLKLDLVCTICTDLRFETKEDQQKHFKKKHREIKLPNVTPDGEN